MSTVLDNYLDILEQPNKQCPPLADGTVHINDVYDHLPRFRKAAHGNVLEIGTRRGLSTCALLLGVEENGGHLYSVDINDCGGIFAGHPQWTFIQADSAQDVVRIKSIIPIELDLLFVDGDHKYEGVLSDFKNFAVMAKIVMAHDTNAPGYPDVSRVIKEYMALSDCRHKKDFYFMDSYGLAVLI